MRRIHGEALQLFVDVDRKVGSWLYSATSCRVAVHALRKVLVSGAKSRGQLGFQGSSGRLSVGRDLRSH